MSHARSGKINAVLECLADGQFHSGQHLGQTLAISRAAVNQHVQKLQQLGLDVFSVSGKGYRLAQPLELLAIDRIADVAKVDRKKLSVKSVVGSSNDEIRELISQQALTPGYGLFAEAQTAGRGRRGKQWHSPFGSNLYISVYWPLNEGINRAMGLSLVVGIAVADCLRSLGITGVGVKWPNDVYVKERKIAGVLVDIDSRSDGAVDCTIGVGVNLHMPSLVAERIDQQWTDVAQELATGWSRNDIAGRLYRHLLIALKQFTQDGFSDFQQRWRELDIYYQRQVTLLMGQRRVTGECRGIDENGAILIQQQDKLTRYFGGEISLRGADASH